MLVSDIVTIFTNGNEAVIYTNDGFHKRSYFIIYHKRPKTIKEFCDIENAKYYEYCQFTEHETFLDSIKYEFQMRNLHKNIQKEVKREKGVVKSF